MLQSAPDAISASPYWLGSDRVELVLASFRGDRSVAEICREHDLSEMLLRRWRDQMIAAGAERFTDGVDRSVQAEHAPADRRARAGLGEEDL
jgi:transposase